jgi:hypothetical protein
MLIIDGVDTDPTTINNLNINIDLLSNTLNNSNLIMNTNFTDCNISFVSSYVSANNTYTCLSYCHKLKHTSITFTNTQYPKSITLVNVQGLTDIEDCILHIDEIFCPNATAIAIGFAEGQDTGAYTRISNTKIKITTAGHTSETAEYIAGIKYIGANTQSHMKLDGVVVDIACSFNAAAITVFQWLNTMTNCSVFYTGPRIGHSFTDCDTLNGCSVELGYAQALRSTGNSAIKSGFYSCNNLIDCYVVGSVTPYPSVYATHIIFDAFRSCYSMTGCIAAVKISVPATTVEIDIDGFHTCRSIRSCVAALLTHSDSGSYTWEAGFNACSGMSGCYACVKYTSSNNIDVFGVDNCRGMMSCHYLSYAFPGASTAYNNGAWAGIGSNANPAADTAAGGYNSTSELAALDAVIPKRFINIMLDSP